MNALYCVKDLILLFSITCNRNTVSRFFLNIYKGETYHSEIAFLKMLNYHFLSIIALKPVVSVWR